MGEGGFDTASASASAYSTIDRNVRWVKKNYWVKKN